MKQDYFIEGSVDDGYILDIYDNCPICKSKFKQEDMSIMVIKKGDKDFIICEKNHKFEYIETYLKMRG